MSIYLLIIPLSVVILSQILKIILQGDFSQLTFRYIFSGYGGMPSSHTAFLASALTLIALFEGIHSPIFLISIVFSLIIVRDALGLRRFIEDQAIVINKLMALKSIRNEIPNSERKHIKSLTEDVGHTFEEVIAGAIFGMLSTYFIYLFL